MVGVDLAALLTDLAIDAAGVAGGQKGEEAGDDGRGYGFSPQDLQVFYQIAIHGQRDLPLAPDVRSGLMMTLLRMLAFAADAQPAVVATAPAGDDGGGQEKGLSGAAAARAAAIQALMWDDAHKQWFDYDVRSGTLLSGDKVYPSNFFPLWAFRTDDGKPDETLVPAETREAEAAVRTALVVDIYDAVERLAQTGSQVFMGTVNRDRALAGFEAMRAQQEAFFKAMTGGIIGGTSEPDPAPTPADDLDTIKQQLAEMQEKLSKIGK